MSGNEKIEDPETRHPFNGIRMPNTHCPPTTTQPLLRRARTLLTQNPEAPVIHNGAVLEEQGVITAVGSYPSLAHHHHGPVYDTGDQFLLPGLINAHTHIELSHLRGRLAPGTGFENWVTQLLTLPAREFDPGAAQNAIHEMENVGICAVGDISGHSPSRMATVWHKHLAETVFFVEHIGFAPLSQGQPQKLPTDTDLFRAVPTGHALYSTLSETLRQTKNWCRSHHAPFSLHLAEHVGEVDFLTTGQGTFASLLRKRLVPASFTPPGCHPVLYADSLGLLDPATLAVHCVHVPPAERRLLAQRGCTVCLCPRSNAFIDVGRGPWEKLDALGVPLCLGTDSLASNWDLDLWREAWYIAQHWSGSLTLEKLIGWMTRFPARILGLSHLGQLRPGKKAVYATLSFEEGQRLPLA